MSVDASRDEQQLIDLDIIERFTRYCNIAPDETVLEIGPGAGNITESLLERARYLICIEKNQKFIQLLEDRFRESDKIKIIHDDALKTYLPKHDRLVSNLPYMIGEAFFQRTLRLGFKSATFILPKSFAETLTGEGVEYTKLTWQSKLFYDITYNETVPPTAYLPEPKVSTAIITLAPRQSESITQKTLVELIKQGDKYTKNGLRESLIKANAVETKKEARNLVNELDLDELILGSWVSRLNLSQLQRIETGLLEIL